MDTFEQKRFEMQVKRSFKHLYGSDFVGNVNEMIVFEHETALSFGIFNLKLSIDEIEFYKAETHHNVYTYLARDTVDKLLLEDKHEETWYEQRTYMVTTVTSPHEYISVSEKQMYGVSDEPCIFRKIELEEDYFYDMFSCQILIPVPRDISDYEMKFHARDIEILSCVFSIEQYEILKFPN